MPKVFVQFHNLRCCYATTVAVLQQLDQMQKKMLYVLQITSLIETYFKQLKNPKNCNLSMMNTYNINSSM